MTPGHFLACFLGLSTMTRFLQKNHDREITHTKKNTNTHTAPEPPQKVPLHHRSIRREKDEEKVRSTKLEIRKKNVLSDFALRISNLSLSFSLLCNVAPYARGCIRSAPFSPQCSPGVFVLRVANRHGDFVWSRGETRDPSKAENRAASPTCPPFTGSAIVVYHYSC